MLSGEATNTNLIVFGLIRQFKHANYCATDVLHLVSTVTLFKTYYPDFKPTSLWFDPSGDRLDTSTLTDAVPSHNTNTERFYKKKDIFCKD
jgi:hypothetical protein